MQSFPHTFFLTLKAVTALFITAIIEITNHGLDYKLWEGIIPNCWKIRVPTKPKIG